MRNTINEDPSDPRRLIPNKVDFYITNVCNLTCENCNRFNNYKFTGWQRWEDYADVYQQWSQRLKLSAITIMGGEPFLNPTLPAWVEGLNNTFEISVQILTNGTRFRQAGDLYSKMLYTERNGAQNSIGVSMHVPGEYQQLREDILYFLQGKVTELSPDENPWQCPGFVDSNGVRVNVYTVDEFGPSALQTNHLQQVTVHRNDPFFAHQACGFVRWKSYHFIRGNLYQCAPVALLPEFDQQHKLPLTDDEREIMYSYKPLSMNNYDEYADEFFKNIGSILPQCQFCPVEHKITKIFPVKKGT